MHPYIHFFERIIPSFGVMMIIAILTASIVAGFRCKKRSLSVDDLIIMITITLTAALLGAKLMYIFVTYSFEEIGYMITNGQFGILLNSGLIFYGGLIAGVLGLWICYKWFKIDVLSYEHAVMPVLPLGHAIGRVGCFLAGCCHGKHYEGALHVNFAEGNVSGLDPSLGYFPSQVLSSVLNLCIFVILLLYIKREPKRFKSIYLYIMLYGVARFIIEFTRGDEIRGVFAGLYTSQWVSLIICTITAILIFKKKKK